MTTEATYRVSHQSELTAPTARREFYLWQAAQQNSALNQRFFRMLAERCNIYDLRQKYAAKDEVLP